MVAGETEDAGPTRAIRLTLVHDGKELKVISSQSVKMRVPPSDPTYGMHDKAGFWFEVHSAEKECVYRRVLPNPFEDEVEAPSGDPERPFTRAKAPAKQRVAVLLVPDVEEARELLLCSSPKGAPVAQARAFAAIDLRKPVGKARMIAARDASPKRPAKKGRTTDKKGRK